MALFRHYIFTALLCGMAQVLLGQVFMRPVDNAGAMGVGGATVAYPGADLGLGNEALAAWSGKANVLASSALPFGIGGWNTARLQARARLNRVSGLSFDVAHSGIESYGEQSLGIGYGRKLTEKVYLGIGASVFRVSALEYGNLGAATASVGLLVRALPKLWLGARVQNPVQQKAAEWSLPTFLRIGAAWKPTSIFVLMAEMEKDLDRPSQIKVGMEYRPVEQLVLRCGTRNGRIGRASFGAGLALKSGLGLDVAAEWHPSLGITPSGMISYKW